jgi:hypothetical protein
LLEALQAFGFGEKWRRIIFLLLSSASSRVLLNGTPGRPFTHRRGLRQGDPLAPMLFILALEPLHRILKNAAAVGILSNISEQTDRMRTSFYADDAALFLNPVKEEVKSVFDILTFFGKTSGLHININKCTIFPIRCEMLDQADLIVDSGCSTGSLPCTYLGLPLSCRKPRKIDCQKYIDKIASKLKAWKGKLMSRKGRLILVNSVLTSSMTYFLTIFDPPKWMTKKIDRIRRNFLWCGEENASGAKCMVNWRQVCSPKHLGGLGIKDLSSFSRALRLRWLWFDWHNDDRPWHGLPLPVSSDDMLLFHACTILKLGNGAKALFWKDPWHQGIALQHSFPGLFKLAWRKNLTVKDGLTNGTWMKGLQRINSPELIDLFVSLWNSLQLITLSPDEDTISWTQASDNYYTASSAYSACFFGRIPQPLLAAAWDVKIEGKIKFFLWLLLQNRLWTADRLQKRGWPHQDRCSLCDQTLESAYHLFLGCSFAKEVWHGLCASHAAVANIGSRSTSILGWWKKIARFRKSKSRREHAAVAVYALWHIWKERNRRIFENISSKPEDLIFQIRDALANLKAAHNE